jgi:hypothetical protein
MLPDQDSDDRFEDAIESHRIEPGRGLPRDIAYAQRVLNRVWRFEKGLAERLASPLLAAVGRAGAGKTHLAASLSGPADSARGVLLLGLDFGAQIADDDLARFSRLCQSRDELLEAMEAVGVREGRRVPLVIDGLNEADEPAKWRAPLARLAARLSALRHVVGIVTVRPRFVELTLPEGTPIKEIPGLVGVEEEAVERYFTYYKIKADHRALHWWRPSDALLLSIFCRTVNPERVATVGVADLPDSLHEVFDSYLGGVFGRIGAVMEIDQADVRSATLQLAYLSLETGARGLDRAEASRALGDEERAPHRKALRFHLENEEIISREATDTGEEVLWSYDLLAGHLIASSILERHADRHEIGEPDLSSAIAAHPLVEDIVAGLSGLLVKENIELAGLLGDRAELLGEAALASVRLGGPEIGGAGLEALARLFTERPTEVLEAISSVTLRSDHPMNGRFLDTLLSGMAVWERDLVWTEWIRGRVETVAPQLSELGRAVREGREEVDMEGALSWLSWLLTTTDKRLRDEATYVLYEVGRAAPELLHARCIQMLDVNDSFVAEGLLAAAYGASMAAQTPGSSAAEATIAFAGELRARIIGSDASQPTTNWLIREYAYRTTQLAAWLSGGLFEAATDKVQPPLPAPQGPIERFERDSEGWSAMDGAFRMDFSNYTIGHLFHDRANYQDDHELFIEVTGEIRARVAALGWSEERFGEIDRSIGAREVTRGQDPQKVERYGKKYSWIAYFEAAGRLSDDCRLEAALGETGRLSDMPIDPSFPTGAASLPFELEPWVSRAGEDRDWILAGEVQIPDQLLQTDAFGEDERWIGVDGFLLHQPGDTERKVFCFLRGILALEGWESVEEKIAADGVDNDLVPRSPSDYYCFAGEAPWSPTFDAFNTDADGGARPDVTRLGRHFEEGPEVELLGVDFSWESYHSVLNEVEVGTFPGKEFARSAGLRRRPDHSEFETEDGRLGAVSVRVSQDGWRGHLLYVREDLLKTYVTARGGDWGWVVWGEREMFPAEWSSEPPDWLAEVRSSGQDRFHRVTSLAQLEGTP